jgi:uncharacterized protein (TIGR02145 family)
LPPVLLSPADSTANVSLPPTLSWSPGTGAASYTLQVSTTPAFTSFVYNQSGLTGTSQEVPLLNHSTQYYWHVNAANNNGTSANSGYRIFTTAPPTNTASISGKVTDISNQAISGVQIYTSPPTSTVSSDASGNYSITNVSAGNYVFIAQKTGYNNYLNLIDVALGQAYTQNIVMTLTGVGSSCVGTPTVTYSGKTYHTIQIGSQCWLKENLDVGIMIDSVTEPGNNGVIEKYCYNNNPANCTTYGGLYKWNEAMEYVTTPGIKGICPPGWHIPTYTEMQKLDTTVSNDGNALKAIGQGTGTGAGTNTSQFSALLAGYHNDGGPFSFLGYYGYFWSSTYYDAASSYGMFLNPDDSVILLDIFYSVHGFNVRCIKDF